jgi:hypothetical protein
VLLHDYYLSLSISYFLSVLWLFQILLSEVGGIWIILGSCIGLGLLCNLASCWFSRIFLFSKNSGVVAAGNSSPRHLPEVMRSGVLADGAWPSLLHCLKWDGYRRALQEQGSGDGMWRSSPLGTPATLDEAMWLANQKLQEVRHSSENRSVTILQRHRSKLQA